MVIIMYDSVDNEFREKNHYEEISPCQKNSYLELFHQRHDMFEVDLMTIYIIRYAISLYLLLQVWM